MVKQALQQGFPCRSRQLMQNSGNKLSKLTSLLDFDTYDDVKSITKGGWMIFTKKGGI